MGSQRAHHDAIVHLGDTGSSPGHSFGFIALDPGTHLSLEYDLAAACLDGVIYLEGEHPVWDAFLLRDK
jgi:hypothetical protein